MTFLVEAFAWMTDPANWGGPSGIGVRVLQHTGFTLVVVAIAAVIALPVGFAIGHTGRGRGIAVGLSGGFRALPTLGVLTIFALWLGIGLSAPAIALVVLAIPPILAGAYSGIEAVDDMAKDAAKGVGMTPLQVLAGVELPLAAPIIIGGIRSAVLQVVATATLAAYIADFGLGRYIFLGLNTNDYPQTLGGSLVVILLALALEGVFALAQRLAVPAGVRAGRRLAAAG